MKKCLLSAVFISALCFIRIPPVHAATSGPVDGALVTVSATVGGGTKSPIDENKRFAVYGYSSPNASIKIQSPIYGETKADSTGFYEFKYLFLTLFREDLCIVAQDTEKRSTPPICIPPPVAEADKRVGPIILPPSTSISAGSAYIGDTVTLTGQTIPNVDVKLSLFTDEGQKSKKLSLIPEAYAYTIPQMSLTSNAKGEYSITLPTASSQFIRMFTRALYEGNSTPKSLTLVLDIFPLWMILFKFFTNFFSLLKSHLIEFIILGQLYFLLMYFMKRYFNPRFISMHRHRELAIIHGELAIFPHDLVVQGTALAKREVTLSMLNSKS
ncbi:MAG: hypothetical protein NTZ55_04045 [Candidatus Roizmanbacteria bacterium]|nr:hypothetical protein [Candidatus Roizmanbacteria bacterium]